MAADLRLGWLDRDLARLDCGAPLVAQLVDPCRSDATHGAPVTVTPSDQPLVIERARRHGVLPQLDAALRGGRVRGGADFDRAVRTSVRADALHRHRLELALSRINAAFRQRGVRFLVLKGLATGRLDYRHPSERSSADIDVLVHHRDIGAVADAAARAGFTDPLPIERFAAKGLTVRDDAGLELDVHTRLHTLARPLGDTAWRDTSEFIVGGEAVGALSRAGRLAHAATHFALAGGEYRKLSSAVDVVRLIDQVDDAERDAAERLLVAMGVSDMTWRVFGRLAEILGDRACVLGAPRRGPLELTLRAVYERPHSSRLAVRVAKALVRISPPAR